MIDDQLAVDIMNETLQKENFNMNSNNNNDLISVDLNQIANMPQAKNQNIIPQINTQVINNSIPMPNQPQSHLPLMYFPYSKVTINYNFQN